VTSQPDNELHVERRRAELAAAIAAHRRHYTGQVADPAVVITREGDEPQLAVLFAHRDFPGVRFGHRCWPDDSRVYLSLVERILQGELHLMMENPPAPDSAGLTWTYWGARIPGIEHQRDYVEAAFRHGWRSAGRQVLSERDYSQARRVLDHGGWTGLDPATVDAVRNGAQPGDPLPPIPYISHVSDTEVIINGTGQNRRVAVLFSYRDFPGVRFGHRFPPDDTGTEQIWLKEGIETGALDRMMSGPPAPDSAGIVWTAWGDPAADAEPG
jgi:hypothetical protein